jgi:multidrug efflux system outer membrane protein
MSDPRGSFLGRRGAFLAAGLLLSACASMAPEYERPAPPVSPAFPEAPPAPADGALAADIQWQDFFADPRLKRLVTVALENNRDLRAAGLAIEQARAQYRIRRADQLPSVDAAVIGQRQPGLTGNQASLYTVGLAVTAYEFDFFGRIRSLSDAALAQYLATEEAQRSARISLIAAIANLYFNLLADEELLEVTRQTLRTREESLKLTKLKFDNGAASELDYRQAEALYESARVTLAQVQRQRALDQNALVLLLGQPMPTDLPPPQPLMSRQTLTDLPVGLPSDVLVRRPDVLSAEQQLIAANANIGAARAAFWPRISLTTSAGLASTELSGLFSDGKFAWTLNPQALLPIFDYGRNKANLQASEAARDIAVARYERTIQDAFREVSDALATRSTLVDEIRAQQAQVRAESARFRLADLRYRNGAASYLDVLDAQRSLFVSQQSLVLVQAAQVQNVVTLYKVLGGGWK